MGAALDQPLDSIYNFIDKIEAKARLIQARVVAVAMAAN